MGGEDQVKLKGMTGGGGYKATIWRARKVRETNQTEPRDLGAYFAV